MDLNFLPSLEHLSAVRVALTIYTDDINHLCEELMRTDEVYVVGPFFRIRKLQEKWINERKEKARSKLSKLLPKSLESRIVNIFQPLVHEITFWFRDHFQIIKHIKKLHYMSYLCWKSEGCIDRMKTAEQLIRNEDIDRKIRFALGCIYFRENEVQSLWLGMSEYDRRSVIRIDSNIAVLFWIRWLRENGASPWTRCVMEWLRNDFLVPIFLYGKKHKLGRVRLSSFFIYLDTSDKSFFLSWLWPRNTHIDEMRLCYDLVEEDERAEVFPTETSDVLFSYLHWPLQNTFLDAVNHLRCHLTCHGFKNILKNILFKKLMRGMQDFDYVQLLRDFWIEIPDEYKKNIQKEKIFTLLRAAMSYDENTHPLPMQELLEECHSFLTALPLPTDTESE